MEQGGEVGQPFCLAPRRKSDYDPNSAASVVVQNDLGFDVDFQWLDYEGVAKAPITCSAKAAFCQRTNSEHPWLICKKETGEELACVCFRRDCRLELGALLRNLASPAGREERNGYLAAGGDFASGVSCAEAERLCLANPSKVMGFTYRKAKPDQCWVKVCGTDFCEHDDWTTVLFPRSGENQRSTKDKDHKAFRAAGDASRSSCWPDSSGQARCEALAWSCFPKLFRSGESRRLKNSRRHDAAHADGDASRSSCWQECTGQARCEATAKTYARHNIGGFAVFVEEGCFETHSRLRDHITKDVEEICRLVPARALGLLKDKAAIWINDVLHYPGEPKAQHGACTHWCSEWPASKGDLPAKGGCVEINQCCHYLDWAAVQPAMLLHELSHAYHCHNKALDGLIKDAYDEAMASGIYATGEYMGKSQGDKPYGAVNHMEFFAESSEAFFSSRRFRNDYFPYVHAELKGFDPIAYQMCQEAWGVRGEDMSSRVEFPERWLREFAKIKEAEARSRFAAAAASGSMLAESQFVAIVAAAVPGIGPEEAKAAMAFADANQDGQVDYAEFMMWLTSQLGAFCLR